MSVLGELLSAAGPLQYCAAATCILALVGLCLLCRHERRIRRQTAVAAAPKDEKVATEPVPMIAEEEEPPSAPRGPFKAYVPPAGDSARS